MADVGGRAPSQVRAVPVRRRAAVALALTTVIGLAGFGWPLFAGPDSLAASHASQAPWLFVLLLPLVIGIVLAEAADGALDAKGIAMLGVLCAVGTALRPLGAGIAGFEPVFLVLALGGRALGPGFGFALGSLTMLTSAALTGGVGYWLPYQMLAAGWFGFGAGCLPARLRGRREVIVLAAYGAVAALLYGLLMNLSFWPWALGLPSSIAFIPGAPISENLVRWIVFDVTTSFAFDIPRAVVTVVLVLALGRPVLRSLRRATRRAAFGAPVGFGNTSA